MARLRQHPLDALHYVLYLLSTCGPEEVNIFPALLEEEANNVSI